MMLKLEQPDKIVVADWWKPRESCTAMASSIESLEAALHCCVEMTHWRQHGLEKKIQKKDAELLASPFFLLLTFLLPP